MNRIRNGMAALVVALGGSQARAADGCTFLLCIAGPWQGIAECRAMVRQVLHDLAMGRALPQCDMSGAGSSADNRWLDETSCPPWYRHYHPYHGFYTGCSYSGRVDVHIDGALWSQMHWDKAGRTATWYSDAAKASLGASSLDPRFETDRAAWEARQPAID